MSDRLRADGNVETMNNTRIIKRIKKYMVAKYKNILQTENAASGSCQFGIA